jgi:phage-related baseplate assembly protein
LASILQIAEELSLPVRAWQPGSVARTILTLVAQSIANVSAAVTPIAAGGLLDYASGAWLTLLAQNGYAVTRIEATAGTTDVVLTNTTGIAYPVAAGDLRFFNDDPDNAAEYTSITGGTIPAFGQLTVTVQADQPGTASNAAAGQITGMLTPIQGVSSTNPEPLVGTDEESDDALRQRCREALAALSPNGPRDAYDYVAKTTTKADGSNAGITRTAVSDANATILVWLAQADGAVEPTIVDLVNTQIQTKCVPSGFTATVVTANALSIPITCTVYLSQGSTLNSDGATQLIQDQLTSYFSTIPIGGFNIGVGGQVLYDALIGQIYNASNQFITVTLASPAGDTALSADQVATLGQLTVTVVQNPL